MTSVCVWCPTQVLFRGADFKRKACAGRSSHAIANVANKKSGTRVSIQIIVVGNG